MTVGAEDGEVVRYVVDRSAVRFHSFDADAEHLGNLLVAAPLSDQLHNAALAGRKQLLGWSRIGQKCLEECLRRLAGQVRPMHRKRIDTGHQLLSARDAVVVALS